MITASAVRLDPATVPAGDVYVVLDAPLDGSIVFVQHSDAPESPGPLSDDDLVRLAHGDTQGTSIGGMGGGCSAAQRAEDRGQQGPCGNVMKLVLRAGKYAILSDTPEVLPPMAVLEVLP